MSDGVYVTIAKLEKYYGLKPFQVGNVIKLIKGKIDQHEEAICAELPYIGVIGVVAEQPEQVAGGTLSGGRLYDRFEEVCFAQVRFTMADAVIAQIVNGGHLHILFSVDEIIEQENENILE